MKQKAVKRNSHVGDVDYIPSAEDDSEDDDQQVSGSVVASKNVSSTSNATKRNKTQQIVTMMDDDEDDEIFKACSRVDMEVDDVDQDDGYEDIDSGIGGRLHSDSYETGSQHEGSDDDDESTVG
ncbi:hypothetical protein E3N88_43654 [Mikania micrantha]|uniref:Uncharacterized protein n=1 Tax=Mikania micrantha TaxID=192012 RepID=A0A5N6LEA7_9ASTR|nr:hypothetical protein E3N88_43654 [Mikania micrantha]